jgi:glycosyltransferase involved in cell wall biosynthesis
LKILQINTTVNSGSTGRIAEDIGRMLIEKGHLSYIAYGRKANLSSSRLIKIGNKTEFFLHVLKSRLLDRHGFGSEIATKIFLRQVDKISPDLVHLHLIHGYYLNIRMIFEFFKTKKLPVVWTFHDCWPITGHCSYFDAVDCYKWQRECYKCPNLKGYPVSWLRDNSKNNFHDKSTIFTGLNSLNIITPSNWLAEHVKYSFLKEYPVNVIHNGVDLSVFKPIGKSTSSIGKKVPSGKFILGVANTWDKRKGLTDFFEVRKILSEKIHIVLVGLNPAQIAGLPEGITGIQQTENIDELVQLYSEAEVFVNPTYVDNFPTTNLESISCGTPVITYNTGGSPEAIDNTSGIVVDKGDVRHLVNAILEVIKNGKGYYSLACRKRSELLFDKNARFCDYLELYKEIVESR